MKLSPLRYLSYITLFVFIVSCNTTKNETKTPSHENLLNLAKTYGYIKYFYPSDEAANLDWDLFAVLASQSISQTDNVKTTLENLFLPIAPAVQFHSVNEKPSPIPATTDSAGTLMDIYWQHIGNGERSIGSQYKSARVNRKAKVLPNSNNTFTSISQEIDVSKLKGKDIKIKTLVRPNVICLGKAYLAVRHKSKTSKWNKLNSTDQDFKKNIWNEHTLEFRLPQNTDVLKLAVQGYILHGSFDVDKIELLYKEAGEWNNFELMNDEFDNQNTFEADWKPFGPNQVLNILSKNDNRFLRIQRNMGEIQEIPKLFEHKPITNRVLTKDIGANLQISFPIVLKGDSMATFPIPNPDDYQGLLADIEAAASEEININNSNVRLANIIKVWSVINHFFPYFDRTTVDWENEFFQALKRDDFHQTYEDHLTNLKLMLAPLKDSHIGVYSFSKDNFFPPINWDLIEDQLVITQVLDSTLSLKSGDIVRTINGADWKSYWDEAYQKASGATASRKRFKSIEASLSGQENSSLDITVGTQNKKLSLKRSWKEEAYDEALEKNMINFEELEEDIYYANLQAISWKDLKEKLPDIADSKGIIFDLRGYPNYGMLNLPLHLTKDSLSPLQFFVSHSIYPDQIDASFRMQDSNKKAPQQPYISATTVFLTDGRALSFSETLLNLVEFYDLVAIVGEQTAGSTGLVNSIYLFGDISIPWTGTKVLRQDGSVFHGRGILPTYPVIKTIKAVEEGRDEYLEYALELIKN